MLKLLLKARGLAGMAAVLMPLLSIPVRAQTVADSSEHAPRPAQPSAAGYGDTLRATGVDTSRGTSPTDTSRAAPAADTSRAAPARDSSRRSSPDSTGASLPQAGIPTDSVLSVTCRSIRGGTVAPGLLLVLFRDSATQKDRSAAVTRAGGGIVGEAPGGGAYVRVASDTMSARTLADQLVLDSAVATVSERTCPSGP
jgi:hypothetical protein